MSEKYGHFDCSMSLFYKVHDSEIYGGTGSVGYAEQEFHGVLDAEAFAATENGMRENIAKFLGVPPEKCVFISRTEYEEATKDEDDDANDQG